MTKDGTAIAAPAGAAIGGGQPTTSRRFLGSRVDARTAWWILGLAAALRAATVPFLVLHHPDEIWQYLEPAYGLVTGYWTIAWEYRAGIRTWLIPTFIAAPMALGRMIADDPAIYLVFPRIVMAGLSLGIVAFGMALAGRISRWHGIAAGFVLAIWFELNYFSARVMSEPLGTMLLLAAAWCLLPRLSDGSARRTLCGGLALGLAFCARFQMAPALAVLALCSVWRMPLRLWTPLVAGVAAALAVDGLCDALQGAVPFRWVIENFRINLIDRRSEDYGTEAPFWYIGTLLRVWGGGAPIVLLFLAIGVRRMPVLTAVAVVNLAFHMAVPHKEYRFIIATGTLLMVVAAVGSVDALAWLRRRIAPAGSRRIWLAGGMAIWLGCSFASALSPGGTRQWKSMTSAVRLMRLARSAPHACGLATLQSYPPLTMAYVIYDRRIPIYVFDGPDAPADLARHGGGADAVLAARDRAVALGPAWHQARCIARRRDDKLSTVPDCLYVRSGGCTPPDTHRFDVNEVLRRAGR